MPSSEEESQGLDRLTLTIVVASVVVGVLLAVLLFTFCGCCWLQHRSVSHSLHLLLDTHIHTYYTQGESQEKVL